MSRSLDLQTRRRRSTPNEARLWSFVWSFKNSERKQARKTDGRPRNFSQQNVLTVLSFPFWLNLKVLSVSFCRFINIHPPPIEWLAIELPIIKEWGHGLHFENADKIEATYLGYKVTWRQFMFSELILRISRKEPGFIRHVTFVQLSYKKVANLLEAWLVVARGLRFLDKRRSLAKSAPLRL